MREATIPAQAGSELGLRMPKQLDETWQYHRESSDDGQASEQQLFILAMSVPPRKLPVNNSPMLLSVPARKHANPGQGGIQWEGNRRRSNRNSRCSTAGDASCRTSTEHYLHRSEHIPGPALIDRYQHL